MISKTIRNALLTQFSTAGSGLNDRLTSLAPSYGIDPAYQVDWSTASTNFLFGRINPVALEQSSVFTFPFLTIDTLRSVNTNRIKYSTFSGQVTAIVEVHHSWIDESVIADFASMVDLTEEAVIACLNDKAHQTWVGNLLWNGNVSLQRGSLAMGGLGWLQSVQFICQFDLTV